MDEYCHGMKLAHALMRNYRLSPRRLRGYDPRL